MNGWTLEVPQAAGPGTWIVSAPEGRESSSRCVLIHAQLFATPWTVAHQAPLFTEFPRQEYYRELPFPSPRDHPNPRIKLRSEVYKKVLVLPTPEVLSVWLASCYSGGTRHCRRPWTIQLDDLTEHDPITFWVLTDPAHSGRVCAWESDLQEKLLQRNAL